MQAGQPITFNGSAGTHRIENLSVVSNHVGQPLTFETNGITRLRIADDGNASFSGDLTIQGSVSIEGTTTTINATQVDIGDNIIVLNAGESGTPTMNAGVEIERGTATNVSVLWNETNDRWDVSGGTFNAPTLSENAIDLEDKYLGIAAQAADSAQLGSIAASNYALLAQVLQLSGGTMSGALNMGSQKITNLDAPGAASDAATRQYVDDAAADATMSAANILTSLKTVDGAGTGLDADLLDGLEADVFMKHNGSVAMSGALDMGSNDISNASNITATNMLIGTNQVLHEGNLPVTAAKDGNGDTVYTFDALP